MLNVKNQAGDTIVEVMLSIAIVGMVLGGAYATATRALRNGRFAQEQTEALKIAESQVEKLKYMTGLAVVPNSANDIFSTVAGAKTFCINDTFVKVLQSSPTYAANCTGISGAYSQLITYDETSGLFRVAISWQRQSQVDGQVIVAYRLFR